MVGGAKKRFGESYRIENLVAIDPPTRIVEKISDLRDIIFN